MHETNKHFLCVFLADRFLSFLFFFSLCTSLLSFHFFLKHTVKTCIVVCFLGLLIYCFFLSCLHSFFYFFLSVCLSFSLSPAVALANLSRTDSHALTHALSIFRTTSLFLPYGLFVSFLLSLSHTPLSVHRTLFPFFPSFLLERER